MPILLNEIADMTWRRSGTLPVTESMQTAAIAVLTLAAANPGCAQQLQQIDKLPAFDLLVVLLGTTPGSILLELVGEPRGTTG